MIKVKNLSNTFHNFSNRECQGSSLLYEFLAGRIAEDLNLLEISTHASKDVQNYSFFGTNIHIHMGKISLSAIKNRILR